MSRNPLRTYLTLRYLGGNRAVLDISYLEPTCVYLFEISPDYFNHVFSGFFGRLRILGHVIPDVIFQQLAHQAVDRSSGSSQALENIRALFIFVQATQGAFQLADDLLGTIY